MTKMLIAAAVLSLMAPDPTGGVGIDMRNVHLRVAADAALDINWLHGTLRPTRPGQIPVFDDPSSFDMAIEDAELSIDAASLTALVNHAFAFKGSNLSDLTVSFEGPYIVQHGKLSKGVTVPFTVTASVSVTPEGLLRIHPEKMKTAGVPASGLMHLFGIELDNLVHQNPARGIRIEKDDLLLDSGKMLPPPATSGHLVGAAVRDNHLMQTFGRGAALRPKSGGNYIWFRGGTIRFGKLTMSDADLQLIDQQQADPFDFYSAKYDAQLVAGYSKNTPQHGLRTYMPDYRRVGR
ncbi:MAG TPA: hypothetical protein VGI12_02545 [Vicinamibacterales bacterium]|jgi:hypothetical protein